LKEKGISVYALGPGSLDVLVLGRWGWDEEALDGHIEARAGTHLRVYSQEMFLAFMAIGRDPYEDAALLKAFGEDHPALDYLSTGGFDWANTTIVPSKSGGDHGDPETWPKESPLKLLGYTVGVNGQIQWERQKTLRAAFTGSLPRANSADYMAKWGRPQSGERLEQIAIEIAAFVRSRKRQRNPPIVAIEHWEEDLAWLKETFYRGKFRFSWPSTHVRS
jgi:hypothetical protein